MQKKTNTTNTVQQTSTTQEANAAQKDDTTKQSKTTQETLSEFPFLDKLISAGTDKQVVELYHSLPRLVKELDVKLIEDEYVVADCETTGLDCNCESLIEVSACILVGNKITERFDMFVNPQKEIPPEIVELTGITQDDVKDAPCAQKAVEKFAEFAGGRPIIAHNASFDYSFIMPLAKEGSISHEWLDSLALSNIVLPRLCSHKLPDLAHAFNLHASTHRANDDVEALAQLWPLLIAGVHALPAGVANYIAHISPKTRWNLRRVFQQAAAIGSDKHFSLSKYRNTSIHAAQEKFSENTEHDSAKKGCGGTSTIDNAQSISKNTEQAFPNHKEIDVAFSKDGLLGKIYPNFEPRASQTTMAHEVLDAFIDKHCCVLEANTGVGKSMAYLLPAALSAKKNKSSFGVSTKTNALMDQLMFHELPDLAHAIDNLNYIALKGYDHYVCLRKLERFAKNTQVSNTEIEYIAAVLGFCIQSTWTDLDSLHMNRYNQLRTEIVASPFDCLKRICPYYKCGCYLHGARRFAQNADIVLTNHALLFCNMQADSNILPPIKNWIVDEAHAVEKEARKQLSTEISAHELHRVLRKITDKNSGLLKQVRKKAADLDGASALYAVLFKIEEITNELTETSSSFFLSVKNLGKKNENTSKYKKQAIWISEQLRASEIWHDILKEGSTLKDQLEQIIKEMRQLIGLLEGFEEKLKEYSADATQITMSLSDMTCALKLVLSGEDKDFVYSAILHSDKDCLIEALIAEKLDIGATLAERFYPELDSVVFTSATLSTGDAKNPFKHFLQGAGLLCIDNNGADKEEESASNNNQINVNISNQNSATSKKCVKTMSLPSDYNFDEQMHIILPTQMPEANKEEFDSAFFELLYGIHVALNGSVLTLFTSKNAMQKCYYELKDRFKNAGLEIIMQTNGSRASVQERFIKEKSLSLFALKSFWEGFDAPGDTLRCVVIARLPFSSPYDPLVCERNARETNSWWHYSLPESITEIKQASGRLIRCSTDEGFLVLADGRLQTKAYGANYLRALPSKNIQKLSNEEIFETMKTFCSFKS